MILSDRSIIERLRYSVDSGKRLEIEPLSDPGLQIQPCSVDLTLGERAIEKALGPWADIDLTGGFDLFPGKLILGGTVERVKLPHDLCARVDGKSTWGRRGLLVHITAGLVDPGFDGQITLEILNISRLPIRLTPGDAICQLVLEQLDRVVARPYGASRGSTYSGTQPAPIAPPARGAPPKPPSGLTLDDLWDHAMGAQLGEP